MGVADIEGRRHALYRFYDETNALLYVGITADPGKRFVQHGRHKSWWSQVTTIRIETHPDRARALAAERTAIATERPRYNITLTGTPAPSGTADERSALYFPGDFVTVSPTFYFGEPYMGVLREVGATRLVLGLVDFWDGQPLKTDLPLEWSDVRGIALARTKRPDEIEGWFETKQIREGKVIWHTYHPSDRAS